MMNRRELIKTSALATLGGLLISPTNLLSNDNHERIVPPILPNRIKPGDTIGLISPGGFITEEQLRESIENIENLGLKVKYSDKILDKYGYLGGSDEHRARDLNKMFGDESVNGIICARGGYGCSRILPLLDYSVIAKNPKVFVGYSDITALLYAIYKKTGLITFHGPVGISTFDDFTVENLNAFISSSEEYTYSFQYNNKEQNSKSLFQIRSGKAKGILVGGNLSIMTSLSGTEYELDLEKKVVFIEEVQEDPYRVDRMLTQLIEANNLDKAAGIILGTFHKCDIPKDENPQNSLSLIDVFFDRLSNINCPIVYGLPFGHISHKITLPFGSHVDFDADNAILKFQNSVN